MKIKSHFFSLSMHGNEQYYNFCYMEMEYKNLAGNATIFVYYTVYSQTCIKRSTLGQRKNGLIRPLTS